MRRGERGTAGRTAYDRIWLATVGRIDAATLRDLIAALERASGPRQLELRSVAIERLPTFPPPENAVAPFRTGVLLLVGNLADADAALLTRLNSVIEFAQAECLRMRWPLEVVDFGGAATRFAALRGRPGAVDARAARINQLARRLLERLFRRWVLQPMRQQNNVNVPLPVGEQASAGTTSKPAATRGLDAPSAPPAEPLTRSAPSVPAASSAPSAPSAPSRSAPRAAPASEEVPPVRLGASAPSQVAPGGDFTLRFIAYPPTEEAEVARLLTELSARSEHRLNIHECRWQSGTVVTVRVSARHVEITPAEQTFTWEGRRALLDFDATVADDATEGVVVLKLDVAVDGIVVARLRLDLAITRAAGTARPPLATVASEPARSAFASYSSKDRERVLDRLAAVRIATGLDVFLDCLSLNPGEQWKPRLEREIKDRDLFLLFWSSESAASPWVEWEWRTALTEKGRDAMQLHPLATGVKPPQELKDLHFGDVYMLVREAQIARRAERG
jgi:TIR domain